MSETVTAPDILNEIKAGKLVVVPREARNAAAPENAGDAEALRVALELMNMRQNNGTKRDDLLYEAAAFLKRRGYLVPASPDHTPALFALIEERDRVIQEGGKAITELVTRAEAAEADRDALRALICRIGPHIDAIVCYASTMGEHEPNRIAHEVRAVCSGPSQDEVVGQKIAAQMIAKIDAAVARSGAGHGWLIELKGGVPSWAVVNPEDYDEHWTTDSTRALRFARREDAQSYIDHIGWTEAFPSEHIWDDGERHDQ